MPLPKKAAAKAAGKPNGAAPANKVAAKAPKKAAAPIKPFEDGELCEFKGYASKPAEGETRMFKPNDQVAVVGQRQADGNTFVQIVKAEQYFDYKNDPESVDGEEVAPVEIKRLNKTVERPYALVAVGNMTELLAEQDNDPLATATALFNRAGESFFYLGGALAKLMKEVDPKNGLPVFAGYTDGNKKLYGPDRLADFLHDHFGDEFSPRKAEAHIQIYERVSNLADAQSVIEQLPQVGWWKASMIANHLTDANATKLLKDASSQSETELRETLKTKYTQAGGKNAQGKSASRTTVKKTTFAYDLFEDQGTGVAMVMQQAKKQLNIADDALLFEHIVMEWAGDHLEGVKERAEAAKTKAMNATVKSGIKLPAGHPLAPKADAKAAPKAAKKPAKAAAQATA
jgi:hypothetical protein